MRAIEIDVRLVNGHVDGKPIVLRVKRSTGTDDRRTAKAMASMVRLLWKQPANRRLVEELADGRRSLLDVFAAHEAGTIAELVPAFEDREVQPLLDSWLGTFQASASHKHRIRQCFAQVLNGQRGTVRLSDLPRLLAAYRVKCFTKQPKPTPRAFNYAKQALLAFLRDNGVSKRHPIHLDVSEIVSMQEAKQGVEGLSVEEARAVRDRLAALALHPHGAKKDDHSRGEHAAQVWWAMCCTGMGATEYWGAWEALADRVRIRGTKRPGRSWGGAGRDVPMLTAMPRPEITADYFGHLLADVGASPYQGRKSFAQWMEDAEIPRTRRLLYMGHGAKDVTDLYERRQISAFLAEDTERLRKLLGEPAGLELVQEA